MKTMTKLALTSLACVVLSACGSGGGKGGDNAAQPSHNVISNAQTSTVSPSNTAQSASSTVQTASTGTTAATSTTPAVATGGAMVIIGEERNATLLKKQITTAADFKNSIVVDGKVISINPMGNTQHAWTRQDNLDVCCGKYSDVRFGFVENRGPQDDDYFFYNGNVTQNVPTAGVAQYNGEFLLDFSDDAYPALENSLERSGLGEDDELTGQATFRADFANKTLTGSLTDRHISPINVQATINGNSFNGTAQSGTFRTAADVEGKFYGDAAKELGGVFMDSQKTWGGAFGAAK